MPRKNPLLARQGSSENNENSDKRGSQSRKNAHAKRDSETFPQVPAHMRRAVHPFLPRALPGSGAVVMTEFSAETVRFLRGKTGLHNFQLGRCLHHSLAEWNNIRHPTSRAAHSERPATKKRPAVEAEGRLGIVSEPGSHPEQSLCRSHLNFRHGGGLNFLELGECTQTWRLHFAGAAARSGEQHESGGNEGGKDTDHG